MGNVLRVAGSYATQSDGERGVAVRRLILLTLLTLLTVLTAGCFSFPNATCLYQRTYNTSGLYASTQGDQVPISADMLDHMTAGLVNASASASSTITAGNNNNASAGAALSTAGTEYATNTLKRLLK